MNKFYLVTCINREMTTVMQAFLSKEHAVDYIVGYCAFEVVEREFDTFYPVSRSERGTLVSIGGYYHIQEMELNP
jgi:hypothetical protein